MRGDCEIELGIRGDWLGMRGGQERENVSVVNSTGNFHSL